MDVRIIQYCGVWLLLSALCVANDVTRPAEFGASECAGNAVIRRAVESTLLGQAGMPEEWSELQSMRCSVPVAMSHSLAVTRVRKDPVLHTIALRLSCIPKTDCLPFLVTVPEKSLALYEDTTSKPSWSTQAQSADTPQPSRQNSVRTASVVPGQVVILEWQRATVRLTRKVICLDRGDVGELIRTRPIGIGHPVRAQVIDGHRVKAIL